MSKTITVLKGSKRNRAPLLRLLIRLVTYSTWSDVSIWPIIKYKNRRVGPASEAGGLIDRTDGENVNTTVTSYYFVKNKYQIWYIFLLDLKISELCIALLVFLCTKLLLQNYNNIL